MRWLRLFLLGSASVYPLYWTAQFALFFLPAAIRSTVLQLPLTVVDISYLQATAVAGKSESLPIGIESLLVAFLFCLAIWCLRGDQFLTGGLAMVVLGQSALLPFLNQLLFSEQHEPFSLLGLLLAMSLICLGLFRILGRAGGCDFMDRLALLNLLAVLPQVALWLVFRMRYPFFGTKFLLMLLLPLYVGSLIVSGMPRSLRRDLKSTMRTPVPLVEIFASLLVACLLFAAIGLTTRTGERQHTIVARDLPRLLSL
jgi:hypothetical protein